MDGTHLETTRQEAGHHRRHLLIEQDEIAHDHRVVTDLLECGVRAQGESCFHGNALHRDAEVRARHADTVDVAGLHLPRLAEGLFHGLPVRISGRGSRWHSECDQDTEPDDGILDLL